MRVLLNSGLLKRIGQENLFKGEPNPTASTKKALKRALELLPQANPDVRIFYEKDRVDQAQSGIAPQAPNP